MNVFDCLEQGSPEWKAARAGKITASRCKDARDKLKSGKPGGKQIAYACQVALERITGQSSEAGFETWQMREGTAQEPIARQMYENRTGNLVDSVGAIGTDDGRFLYSPDGVINLDGLLEVKTLFSAERIVQIVGDGVMTDFVDQCMFGLWLTGRQWIDLVIWVPALQHMTVHRIERDEAAIEALEADLVAFMRLVDKSETTLRAALAANDQHEEQAA